MVKSRSNVLQKSREATDEDIKALELSQAQKIKKPHYIQEFVAVISGLDVLYEENDLKKLVILETVENIKSFKRLDIDNLTYSELAKWVSSLKSTKDRVKSPVNAGLKLLIKSNLAEFKKIISKKQDIEIFDKFIKKLPAN